MNKRIKSFTYAFKGLSLMFKSQHNFAIQLVIAVLVILLAAFLNISRPEWIFILICIAIVLCLEIVNSAIEQLTDIVSPEYNEKAGKVKDLAAAAVLLASIVSATIGLIIFVPRIIELF